MSPSRSPTRGRQGFQEPGTDIPPSNCTDDFRFRSVSAPPSSYVFRPYQAARSKVRSVISSTSALISISRLVARLAASTGRMDKVSAREGFGAAWTEDFTRDTRQHPAVLALGPSVSRDSDLFYHSSSPSEDSSSCVKGSNRHAGKSGTRLESRESRLAPVLEEENGEDASDEEGSETSEYRGRSRHRR